MSGRKTSSYSFNPAQQERAATLIEIQSAQRDLHLLQKTVVQRQRALEAVLSTTDQTSREMVIEWTENLNGPMLSSFSLSASTDEMRSASRSCRNSIQAGRDLLNAIERQLNSVKRLQNRAATLSSQYAASRRELNRWLPDGEVENIERQLGAIQILIGECAIADAEDSLDSVAQQLRTMSARADSIRREAIRNSKLETIKAHRTAVTEACNSISEMIANASEGVCKYFHDQIEKYGDWEKETFQYLRQHSSGDSADIDAVILHVAALEHSAKSYSRDLEASLIQESRLIAAACGRQLSELQARFETNSLLLGKWVADDQLQWQVSQLGKLTDALKLDHFNEFQDAISTAETAICNSIEKAVSQEQAHERRIYLVSSLLQVCEEMGFMVTQKPAFVDPDRRGSQIRVVFDTGNRGEVEFLLSLDSIEVDSCMSGTHCFEEFRQLSEQLRETFGVETVFRGEEKTSPRRIRRGEMDEPTGEQNSSGA